MLAEKSSCHQQYGNETNVYKMGQHSSHNPLIRYTVIHGQCLSVGVGGYLLGGGVNALGASARHGFGAEQVIKMKVRAF